MEQTPEEIRAHYEIEKELAGKLRHSSREERKILYAALYDELFRRVPHHPQLTRKLSLEETLGYVSTQMLFLKRFIQKDQVFVEIGPGDCSLLFEISKNVKQTYGIDASNEISNQTIAPHNFKKISSDGVGISLPPNTADIVYSDQLMEHLHPDDVLEHLENIINILIKGGKYICVTPNRLFGPHDISLYFDEVASGFHLKEYTYTELFRLFKKAGFRRVCAYLGVKQNYHKVPVFMIMLAETLLAYCSLSYRRSAKFKPYVQIRIVGIK